MKVDMPADWVSISSEDYLAHLASFEKMFLATDGVQTLSLKSQEYEYVDNLIIEIYQNNELFFKKNVKPRLHIIKNETPFHFSLPGASLFISTGLINRYVKHESGTFG